MEQKTSGILLAALLAAAASQTATAGDHKTGTGLILKPVNPEGVTVTVEGKDIALPGGAPFSMAQTEVTQGQFERLLGHNPAETDAEHLPVDRVTATEAAAFCKALTERDRAAGVLPEGKIYRLPTLREWLLAALPDGLVPTPDAVGATAWHKDNSAGLLHPVGAKTANAYGLQDMIGNAAEWVTPDAALSKSLGEKNPVSFSSRTVVQVRRTPLPEQAERRDNVFVATQIAIITAQTTLALVDEKLGLSKTWKTAEFDTYRKLKSNLRVEPIAGTDLFELRYRDTNATLAAQIADGIAEAYQKRLEIEESKRANRAIEMLSDEIAAQKEKLEKSRGTMLKIMEDNNIIDLSLGGKRPKWLGPDAKGLAGLRMPTVDWPAEKVRAALASLEGHESDALVDAAADAGIKNPTFSTRYPEYQNLRKVHAQLVESGLAVGHPKVSAVDRQMVQLRGILLDSIAVAKRAMETRLATLETNQKNAGKKREKVERDALAERRQNIAYIESKKNYELNKEVLNSMLSEMAKQRIASRGSNNFVIVHEQAVISSKPIRPPGTDGPIAIGGSVYDEADDLADPLSTDPDARTAGVGFRFVLADE